MRQFIHRTALQPHMLIQADEGFTCLDPYEIAEVEKDDKGEFYVMCRCGLHYLNRVNRQIDERGHVIGFYQCKGMN